MIRAIPVIVFVGLLSTGDPILLATALAVTSGPSKPDALRAPQAKPVDQSIIGRWIEPGGPGGFGLITIRKKGAGLVLLGKQKGQKEEEISALFETHSSKGRQFDTRNQYHDRYTIRTDGSLDISDVGGLIDTASPVLATMTDPGKIDNAIASASNVTPTAPQGSKQRSNFERPNTLASGIKPIGNEALTFGADTFVRPLLRDPESAQFAGLHGSSTSGADYMCGQVNGKNGFGGYSGSQHFILIVPGTIGAQQVLFEQSTSRKLFRDYWKLCDGYDPLDPKNAIGGLHKPKPRGQ
jgi:hypothetical protein